jgi:hypothetical protein
MVHANLHSSAGLLASAWSPALLETKQAFSTYFDHLTDNGTLSFARGPNTHQIGRAVVQALKERGVTQPERHVLMIRGPATVLLAKKRPFTVRERDRVQRFLDTLTREHLIDLDPIDVDHGKYRQVMRGTVLTDAHPYFDDPAVVLRGLTQGVSRMFRPGAETVPAAQVVYHTLAWQMIGTLLAGLALVVIPLVRREPTGLDRISGVAPVLGYVACLGYGYLAVETVLIHELVLFVGHPTYAITVVILAMLLLSGLGSLYVHRLPEDGLQRALTVALAATLALGALQAWVMPGVLHSVALGWPLGVRAVLTFVALAPLGFVMGMPFPLSMRLLPDAATPIVPWAWALNAYMSVVASLVTVLVSRAWGYPFAFGLALVAYGLALGLSARIRSAGT